MREEIESVYSIHIIDRKSGERVFMSTALLPKEVKPTLLSVRVDKTMTKRVYNLTTDKYVNQDLSEKA